MGKVLAEASRRRLWVGIDTAVTYSNICVVDHAGGIVSEHIAASKAAEVHRFLSESFGECDIEVGLESCSTSIPIAAGLRKLGYDVAIFDCFQVKKFASIRRVKSDTNDARSIAEVTRLGRNYLTEVYLKSSQCFEMRAKLVARKSIIRQRQATEQLIRSFIRMNGGHMQGRVGAPHLLRVHVLRALEALPKATASELMGHLGPLIDMAQRQRQEEVRLHQEISTFAEANPVCRRFVEVPGVSALTAVSFFTAIEDPTRFRRCADIGAYFGLTPKIEESGDRSRHGGITKTGNTVTRTHLVAAATVMLTVCKHDTALRRWALDRAVIIGVSKARIALARKLAITLFCMWRDETSYLPEGTLRHMPREDVTLAA